MKQDSHVPVLTYPVERYKGKVAVSLLGEDGMHIRSATDHPLTINGVQVYFNINVKEYEGEWELVKYAVPSFHDGEVGMYPDWSALTVRRVDNFDVASESACKKVLELAEDLAQWVSEDRQEAVILGEVHRLRRQQNIITDEQSKLTARLSEVREELAVCALAIGREQMKWACEVASQKATELVKKHSLEILSNK